MQVLPNGVRVTDESHVHVAISAAHLAEFAAKCPNISLEGLQFATFEASKSGLCYLRGPLVGDDPIPDEVCFWERRGSRPNLSRMIDALPLPTRTVTAVIVGGVLATIFYGPLAEREPMEGMDPDTLAAAKAFWAQHALVPELLP